MMLAHTQARMDLDDSPLIEMDPPSVIVDTAMESPQEASLADDLYFPATTAATSASADGSMASSHRRTMSVISIPASISEGIVVSAVHLDMDNSSRRPSMIDLPPLPTTPIREVRRSSMILQDPIPDDGSALEATDMFPQYTLVSPPTKRSPRKGGRHTRGNSSLQEPDMAVLLARLESENSTLAKDPKSGMAAIGAHTGPESAFQYKLQDTVCSSLSTVRIPQEVLGMATPDFWTLVAKDYAEALSSLPTVTPLMIHKGIPERSRAAVWVGITGASDPALQLEYDSLTDRLKHEQPANESIINKDLARCFPTHETFKDSDGEGQRMLGHILKAYSLYDPEIGYCQGMAFVVGILLLNMPAKDAFCVFVKLMEGHGLRTMYTHDLGGLHSRTYQLKQLLGSVTPNLLNHLSGLGFELAYLSQWFMTMFATTCPFNVLHRIYDVLFAEGADETVMRVALALIVTNEESITAMDELEDVLTLLLGRAIWDPYVDDPDLLIDEVARLCNVVTKPELDKLHDDFLAQSKDESGEKTALSLGFTSGLAGLKFLDGWLPYMKQPGRVVSVSTTQDMPGHRSQRSISKQSIATIDSSVRSGVESLLSSAGTSSTFPTDLESLAEHDTRSIWKPSTPAPPPRKTEDDAHNKQVEGLLLALTEVQREAAATAATLQEERVKRESVTEIVYRLKDLVTQKESSLQGMSKGQRRQTMPSRSNVVNQAQTILEELNKKSAAISSVARSSAGHNFPVSSATLELKEALSRLCGLLENSPNTPESEETSPLEVRKTNGIGRAQATNQVEEANRKPSMRLSSIILESGNSTLNTTVMGQLASPSYFPEATLFDNTQDYNFPQTGPIHKRTSSLAASNMSVEPDSIPTHDAILMELVNAKTREATAIHERDEMKVELDRVRKQQDMSQMNIQAAASRIQELERLLTVEREAHTAELAKTLSALHRANNGEIRISSRKLSGAPPVLEVNTERSNSLWPVESPSVSRSTSVVTDGAQTAGITPPSPWWWNRSKQRSVSTGNAGPGM